MRDSLGGPTRGLNRIMLTDDEIDRLAQAYVLRHYGPILPGVRPLWDRQIIKHFELAEPPGAYFTVRLLPTDATTTEPILLGDAGFFIDRRDGTVRHFDSGEFLQASSIVTGIDVRLGAGVFTNDPNAVRYILTHTLETLRSDLDAAPHRPVAKRWWQRWKH